MQEDSAGQELIADSDAEEEDYEPNLEEIHGYAKFLGMDLETDQEFFYIAEQGLKAPVPEPWVTELNEKQEIFYYNTITGQQMTDHPLDEEYRQKFLRLKAEKEGRPYIPPTKSSVAETSGQQPGTEKQTTAPILNSM